MKDENRDRMGDKFEREMADLFQRIGFVVKSHVFTKKEDGRKSEQDVLATKGNLKILIQCKDYAKFPFENIEEVIEDLVEDGKSLEADKLILAITGHKNLSDEYAKNLKKKGVYLWNEDYWRKLQRIETNQELKQEIGTNLELPETFVSQKKMERLINNANISEKNKEFLKESTGTFENSEELEKELNLLELEEKIRSKKDDIELEEIFELVKSSNLSYNKRYNILKKLSELNLSEDSKRIVGFEKIKTFIEKQEEDSSSENWGDERYLILEKLIDERMLSEKDKKNVQEEIEQTIGISKKGYTDSQKIKIERIIRRAIFKKKLIKIAISLGILAITFIILWRVLF